jgi:hypothetical protein
MVKVRVDDEGHGLTAYLKAPRLTLPFAAVRGSGVHRPGMNASLEASR